MEFAYQIAEQVRTGRVSVEATVSAALARARAVQEEHNAFITIATEAALARARHLDARIAAGDDIGPLAGVPVAVKDNICTRGILTTAGSRSLATFVPPYNATVVERLERAGAVVIAKTNLDEFGMGGSTENSAFGPAHNPWDKTRVPGGSSGGSAIAVAAGVVPIALGTDTGGSVRQPASYNGLIGFKPTYGRLSRYGVVAFASSLDQVGVLCRSSRDLALAMDAMGGHDPRDATSLADDTPAFGAGLEPPHNDLSGLRIGRVRELSGAGNSDGTLAALGRTIDQLEKLGASVQDVSIPSARYGIAAYYLAGPAEASSNLARFDGMVYSTRDGDNSLGQADVMMRSRGHTFGPEVRRRILIGTYALSAGYYDAYYGKALKVRRLLANEIAEAFSQVDLLLTPTAPRPAYPLGYKIDDPLSMYLDDIDTVLANLVGIGALSLPAGQAENGMPSGSQLLAPALHDERLVQVLGRLEHAIGTDHFAPLAPVAHTLTP
ncbi:MAG: Asp-tRNA(Asn)/Glu-tRNA(Gln) amidotransferase subunit GatA [Trueperaceae bacterium]|nr:Asp-tRNA(Asn)/Glu-tRNA(Gln) amidotransferase subunit GatA [Trueperaceae bacterium]